MCVKGEQTEADTEGLSDVTSSMKTESQNRREERLAERAVKGTDFRAEDTGEGREERRDKTGERERERSEGRVRNERSSQRKEGNMVKCLAERDQLQLEKGKFKTTKVRKRHKEVLYKKS